MSRDPKIVRRPRRPKDTEFVGTSRYSKSIELGNGSEALVALSSREARQIAAQLIRAADWLDAQREAKP